MNCNGFNTADARGLRILWEVRHCELTMGELMTAIAAYQTEHPDEEVFLDGDLYSIVSRARA